MIRRLQCCAGLGLVLVLGLPTLGADKRNVGKEATPLSARDEAVLRQAGQLTGQIARINGTGKTLTVQVSYPSVQGGKGKGSRPGGARRGVRVVMMHRAFDLEMADDVQVRQLQLPIDFDEKGRPKKRTPDEIKELKGPDPKAPGYTASFEDLKNGQTVRVVFARKQSAARDADRDANADANKLLVSMILIIADADPSKTPAPRKKGK